MEAKRYYDLEEVIDDIIGGKKMVEKKKESVSTHEILGRWHSVSVTKWSNNGLSNYSIQLGYKRDGEWHNKNISIFSSEVPDLMQAIMCINHDLVKE